MQFNLLETLEVPVRCIKPVIDITQIENYSHFSAVRLAKKYFERQGFSVLDGGDFENNFMLYFYDNNDRLFFDEYIKVKLGKAHVTVDEINYCEQILKKIPEPVVRQLLALCRFCSYMGDPGFPELVLAGKEGQIKYVLFDELSASQKMFLLFSRMLDIEIEIVKMAPEEKYEMIKIDIDALLGSVLNERRTKNIIEGLESNIEEIKTGWEDKKLLDELGYLETEKAKNPLFLFRKWKQQGFLSSQQLKELVDFILAHSRHDLNGYLKDLENDQVFMQMARTKTEDAMKKKAEYMQKKFGLGRSRSKLLLNFF